MSSDEYFDDELDSAFLNEVDAIEAAHVAAAAAASRPSNGSGPSTFKPAPAHTESTSSKYSSTLNQGRGATPPDVIEIQDSSSDYGFEDFPVDHAAFAAIDQACERELAEF